MRRRSRHRTEGQVDIDRHVGLRLRMCRTILGMNQPQSASRPSPKETHCLYDGHENSRAE
jgi:hypothetical protein